MQLKMNSGFTLVELSIVLLFTIMISMALFHGIRTSVRALNAHLAQQQAQGLAQRLALDFELVASVRPMTHLADFLGHLHTRQWPRQASSLWRHSGEMHNMSEISPRVDQAGCLALDLDLRPCWSAARGLRVEVSNQANPLDIVVVRPSAQANPNEVLVGLSMDALMLQNHYFQQTTAHSELDLEQAHQQLSEDVR